MRICIVGGGIIGWSIAATLAPDHDVLMVDKPVSNAGWEYAAGILSPTEAYRFDGDLGRFNLESIACWSDDLPYAHQGYRRIVEPNPTETDLLATARLQELFPHVPCEPTVGNVTLEATSATFFPQVQYVHPADRLHDCQLRALEHGCVLYSVNGAAVCIDEGVVTGVQLQSGLQLNADVTIAATGSWWEWLPEEFRPRLEKTVGERVILRQENHGIGELAKAGGALIRPYDQDRLWFGVSWRQTDEPKLEVGSLHWILGMADALGLGEAEILDVGFGLRPQSIDLLPQIGWVADGLMIAAGAGRDGIVQSRLTAAVVADIAVGNENEWENIVDPKRFNG